MSFRARDSKTKVATLVGLIWLDKNFNPIGIPQILKIEDADITDLYIQDPRLIMINDQLYMTYSDLYEVNGTHYKERKMCFAKIDYDGVFFTAKYRTCLLDFDGIKNNKFEKNWVPFDYQGNLLLSYSLYPHKVFFPLPFENKCLTVAFSQGYNLWDWGELRGGTAALKLNDQYLAFFHSSISLTTVQSEGAHMTHYVMGAYIFQSHPPFAIKKISPFPIVCEKFYNGPMHTTWKPMRVVFPCGFVYDEKHIWISYGRQDHEAWIVKLDREGLLNSLIEVVDIN